MRVVWVGGCGTLTGNQEGKAGPCTHQGGTLADHVTAVRDSQPGVPACPPLGVSDTTCHYWPPLPPTVGLTGSVEGVLGLHPPPCEASYIWDGPLLGIPTATGQGQALLSAHLDYGTSLLTGLPAFSLSQIQLLLHTAARVSSLKHKPKRVIPPLEGLRLLAAFGTGSDACLRTGESLHLKYPFLFVQSPALSSEAGKWPLSCPNLQPHPCHVLTNLPRESSLCGPHALPVGTNGTLTNGNFH